LPEKIQLKIKEESADKLDKIEEIRLRLERPIILKFSDNEKVIKYSVTTEEIIACLQAICENSIYTYQNQIAEGFVTIKGGHRVRNKWFVCYGEWKNNQYKSCI
jgi:stage III sporulation protein AA